MVPKGQASDVRRKIKHSKSRQEATVRGRIVFWGIPVAIGIALALMSYRPRGSDPEGVDSSLYRSISFGNLSSFTYIPSSRKKDVSAAKDPFPPEVLALDGKRITISGFMQPMYVLEGKVREFYLSSGGLSCCFADAPRPTDIIQVTLPPEKSTTPGETARIWGTLNVKEELDESGFPMPLYRVTGDWVRADGAGPATLGQVLVNAGMITLVVAAVLGFVWKLVVPWYRENRIGGHAAFLRQKRPS